MYPLVLIPGTCCFATFLGVLSCLAQTLPGRPASSTVLDASSGLDHARRLVAASSFQAAEPLLRAYLQANESSAEAHTLLAYTLLRMNQPAESLREYTRAAELRAPAGADLRSVAEDYVLLQNLSEADHWMSRALLMNEQDAETWYGLGRIRFSRERFREAAQCFQKTLELSPKSVKAANNLGLAYEGLNETDDAIREYRQALDWQATLPHPSEQPMLNLGIILVHQGRTEEALPLLQKAAAIAPSEPRIHDQLGHLYLQRGEFQNAQVEFERAVSLSPESGAYHFLLGQVYHHQGLNMKAQEEFQRAAALNGTHSSLK